jgi:hypothetical protein
LNSYQVTKLKWYKSSWFKVIIIIVAVVLIVISLIAMQPQIAAAIAKGVIAILTLVAVTLLISIAITLSARFIVKEYGDKLGVVGAIIAVVVAVVIFTFAPDASREFMLAAANYLMQGATALISAANEFLIEEAQEILSDYEAFTSLYEAANKELEVSADLLKNKVDLNPLMFARPERLRIVPNETPDGFYRRCLELPSNTMHVIHEEIPNFFTARLTLSRSLPIEMYA